MAAPLPCSFWLSTIRHAIERRIKTLAALPGGNPAPQTRFTSLALHMSQGRSTVAGGSAGDVHQEPHGNNIGAGGAGAPRRSKLAVARMSRPRPNHQKPGRGVAARP